MKVTQEKVIIGLGVWLFVLPFLGFPASWKTWLVAATGLVIVYLGALLLKRTRDCNRAKGETKTGTFTESTEPTF